MSSVLSVLSERGHLRCSSMRFLWSCCKEEHLAEVNFTVCLNHVTSGFMMYRGHYNPCEINFFRFRVLIHLFRSHFENL